MEMNKKKCINLPMHIYFLDLYNVVELDQDVVLKMIYLVQSTINNLVQFNFHDQLSLVFVIIIIIIFIIDFVIFFLMIIPKLIDFND